MASTQRCPLPIIRTVTALPYGHQGTWQRCSRVMAQVGPTQPQVLIRERSRQRSAQEMDGAGSEVSVAAGFEEEGDAEAQEQGVEKPGEDLEQSRPRATEGHSPQRA